MYGPWQARFDVSLAKITRIAEGKSLEIRAQALNVINSVNLLLGPAMSEYRRCRRDLRPDYQRIGILPYRGRVTREAASSNSWCASGSRTPGRQPLPCRERLPQIISRTPKH
jgi:hypothetical protein